MELSIKWCVTALTHSGNTIIISSHGFSGVETKISKVSNEWWSWLKEISEIEKEIGPELLKIGEYTKKLHFKAVKAMWGETLYVHCSYY